ncbi:SRPBCC domain-containing protein [Sinorhizobium meliloti]|uniref:SRPBCC domain-containing protein n=1 Tax=Rhizobium meliloti TaxID=382 RepID=UPI00299DF9FE|nr:SRPBCC domain-containing protein [Sinorhizobium meliloti]MCK3791846.1 SRPBCC domain-containing protein [Sinorhizobium meliloti]MCK3797023.1 SRPBCC domain-containing protein [Sinorhizobium meliloti]
MPAAAEYHRKEPGDEERFTYSTYIRCSPDVPWQALAIQEVTRQYWAGTWQESDWSWGSPWRLVAPDGRPADSGEVIEADRPNRLVIFWRDELHEDLRQEGHSEVSYVIEDDRHVGKADGPPIIRSGKLPLPSLLCRRDGLISLLASNLFWRRATRWKKQWRGA